MKNQRKFHLAQKRWDEAQRHRKLKSQAGLAAFGHQRQQEAFKACETVLGSALPALQLAQEGEGWKAEGPGEGEDSGSG